MIAGHAMRVVIDEESRLTITLRERASVLPNTAVAFVRPEPRHLGWLIGDLLREMDKSPGGNFGSHGWNTAAAHGLAIILTRGIERLVIGYVECLSLARLDELARFTKLAGIELWLIADTTFSDDLDTFAKNWKLQPLGAAEARDLLELDAQGSAAKGTSWDAPRSTEAPDQPEEVDDYPPVPDDDVTSFLHNARTLLRRDDYLRVASDFRQGFEIGEQAFSSVAVPTPEHLGTAMRNAVASASHHAQVVAIVRGLQASGIRRGWLVVIDLERFIGRARLNDLAMHLDDEDWALLDALTDPREAGVATLSALGLSVDAIANLDETYVALDGSTVRYDGATIKVPVGGRHLLVAQSIYHGLNALPGSCRYAVDQDTEIKHPSRFISALLGRVTRTTGIHFRGRYEA